MGSYTVEYDVSGRVVIEGTSKEDCREELERQLSEVFFTYEVQEARR